MKTDLFHLLEKVFCVLNRPETCNGQVDVRKGEAFFFLLPIETRIKLVLLGID